MFSHRRAFRYPLGWVSVVATIGLTFSTGDRTFAQITPDDTLGSQRSVVTPKDDVKGLPAELIEGGATRGVNLFHSFLDFNIGEGQRAYFANPAQIENILSRVTGGNPSNLLGTLGVLGNANLFFINPHGILFGPNAQLDIRGSFVASTANSLVFNNGFEFSATNPQAPPLLTVNITSGLQYGTNHPGATIVNAGKLAVGGDLTLSAGNLDLQGQLDAGRDLTLQAQNTVQVSDSASLLSGRDMVFQAPVRILGNASYTTGGYFITQQPDGSIVDFLIPHEQVIKADGDVSLTDDYKDQSLYILAGGKVTLDNVTITKAGNETITESISNGMGGTQTISINASDQPTLDVRSGINWDQLPEGLPENTNTSGIGVIFASPSTADIAVNGNIQIQQPNGLVFLTNQFQPNNLVSDRITVGSINTSVQRVLGNGGSVFIDSRGGITVNGQITSNTASNIGGNGGDVSLLAEGSINLDESILSQGLLGGNITLKSEANIFVAGSLSSKSFSFFSPGFGLIASPSGSTGGNITIMAEGDITFKPGLGLSASSMSDTANAGSVFIGAGGNVSFNEEKSSVENISVTSFVEPPNSRSNGSNIPKGGNITIKGRSVSLFNTKLDSHTDRRGDAGDVALEATDQVTFDGGSSIVSQVGQETAGNGGNIKITTAPLGSVHIKESSLQASTLGEGNAGKIEIQAPDGNVEIADALLDSRTQAGGQGSNIEIVTGSLMVKDGAQLLSNTVAKGDAGSISVWNADSVTLINNSKISTTVESGATGNGGTITLQTRSLSLNNGEVSASTAGEGNAGSISVQGANLVSLNNSTISTAIEKTGIATQPNLSGNIDIQTRQLSLTNSSEITAKTSGQGDAGSITVQNQNPQNGDFISLSNSSITTAVEAGAIGDGGNIDIQTRSLSLDNAKLRASSDGQGEARSITVRDSDTVSLSNNSLVSTETSNTGKAGDITFTTGTLTVEDSQVSATTTSKESLNATGGRVNINANQVNLSGDNSGLFARTEGVANAGELTLQPNGNSTLNINLSNNSQISASTSGSGTGGSLKVTAPEAVTISGNGQLSAATTGSGQAGGVDITTQTLNVQNGARVSATTSNSGQGGNVTVIAPKTVTISGNSQLSAATTGSGQGGKVEITTPALTVDGATISASTSSTGNAGSIFVRDANSVFLFNNSKISTAVEAGARGNGGDITIETGLLSLTNGAQLLTLVSGPDFEQNLPAGEGNAGSINIQANSLSLNTGARILASTAGKGNAGNITVQNQNGQNADTVVLSGNSEISTAVNPGAIGQGGTIIFKTRSLSLDNARISASTSGIGNAGSIFVQNADSVSLDNSSISTAIATTGVATQPSNIQIQTRQLSLTDSEITASTAGQGDAGSIAVQNADSVFLTDNSLISTETRGTGNAGSITFDTKKLTAQEGARVSASTSGSGKGGSIRATANTFEATSGAQFRTTTAGTNDAGDITFKVQDSFSLSGEATGLFADTEAGFSGNGGSIFIDPRTVTIRDGAKIAVDSQGTGEGGNILIQAGSLTLDKGTISATTLSSNGGDINLDIQDFFLLRRGSRVSTNAGTAQAGGNGGNIKIKARYIIATPGENNDITANAFLGKGGRIDIEAKGILGIEGRVTETPFTNDITASSAFGINGEVNINQVETNQIEAVASLPETTVNLEPLQACPANAKGAGSSFVDTRRGGLPTNPNEISSNTVWEDIRSPLPSPSALLSPSLNDSSSVEQIIEAQGWIIEPNGKIVLTTQASTVTPNYAQQTSASCDR